jgi:integrase/recombinase XerD
MKRYPGVREIRVGAVYEISYYPYPKAKRVQIRVKATSPKEAFDQRAQLLNKSAEAVPMRLTFEALKERLRLKCKADGNSPKTIVNLLGKFNMFFEVFLPKYHPDINDINQINKVIVEQYKQYIVNDLKRTNGWRDELTKIKSIISKLCAIGCCHRKIYDEVLRQFKKPKKNLKHYKEVTKEQMKQLLDYIDLKQPQYYGVTYMAMRLGWRREQIISLKRSNVKVNGFRPIEIVCEAKDTKNKEPFILRNIDDELAKVIKRYLFDGKDTSWLFPSKRGQKIHSNHYTAYISSISSKIIGVRVTPHDFRHNFCTQRLREGAVERDVMAITGHKDPESFRIYVHATSEGTKQVLNKSKIF